MKRTIDHFLATQPRMQVWASALQGWIPRLSARDAPRDFGYEGSDFVLVVGAGRSGNTLFRRLLMEGGAIYIPPETYVLAGIASNVLRNPRLCWSSQVDLVLGSITYQPEFHTFGVESLTEIAAIAKHWPYQRRRAGNLLVETYRWLAEKNGIPAAWVGDKTPLNTLRLGLIDKLFPASSYVFMLRNPFDVVMSYVKSRIYSDYLEAADRWLVSYRAWRAFRSHLPTSRFCEIRFENLLKSPSAEVDRVMRQFGIPQRRSRLTLAERLGDVSVHVHHKRVLGEIQAANASPTGSSVPIQLRKLLAIKLNDAAVEAGYEPLC